MEQQWDYSISSKKAIFNLNLREVWRYRDLLMLFVKRDFVSFYKQTILGPLWMLIQPLFTTFIYVFIFGNLAQLSTDGLPKPLFYLTGIVGWTFFYDCITKTSGVLLSNANLFAKVYFPRLIMPFSIFLSSVVRLTIQIVLLILLELYLIIYKGFEPNITLQILYLPIILLFLSLLGLGLGLIISSLTVKYRDLNNFLLFGVQLLMYASPIVYPLSSAPEKYKAILKYNPIAPLVEGLRACFLGTGVFDPYQLIYPGIFASIIFIIGILVFNASEKDFVDSI
jgi:lipopolysaccharide transport system permease protein